MTDRDIVQQEETRMMESPRKAARVCMLALLATVVGLAPMRTVAGESETDLAKKTQNPVADLIGSGAQAASDGGSSGGSW